MWADRARASAAAGAGATAGPVGLAGLTGLAGLLVAGLLALALALVFPGCGGDSGRRAADPRLALLPPDSLAVWIAQGRPFLLLDVRADSLYEVARIGGAIKAHGLEWRDLSDVIPEDPRTPVVFVGQTGERPAGAPDRSAEAAGYTRVLWLEGGMEAWLAAGLPASGSRSFPRR